MAQQIVITSLEKTLTGGSGYGLAGASPNIPDPVRKRILSLAGYGFVRRSPSPVNWVGLRLETSSGSIGVLGRIAEAPNDYSGRDNFIGHFLLIPSAETASFHPGQILDRFAWITTWSGPARTLETPRLPPGAPAYPISPSPWEKTAGDRGFAGCPWDCLEAGKKLLFTHDLDANQLKALVVETLAMAPALRAWNLGFSTHAEDFPEAQRSALLGTHAQSRLSQKWDLDGVPHLSLPHTPGAPPLLAPPGSGVNQARKSLFLLPEVRQSRTSKTRSRSAEAVVHPEILVDAEVLVASQVWPDAVPPPLNDLPPPPAPEAADPWKMLLPASVGFFVGAIGTAILFLLANFFFQPREKEAKGNGAVQGNGAGQGNGKAADKADGGEAEKKGNNLNADKEPKGERAKDEGAKDPPANGNPANFPIEPFGRLFTQPLRALAALAEPLRMPEGIAGPKDQWVRQTLLLSHLQNMADWKADERALLRPDRFFILVRQLEEEKSKALPPMPDPFTFQKLDQLKTPIDEIAWLMEGSRLLKSTKRSSTLALLSFIANQERVQAKCEELSKKASEKEPKESRFDAAFWRDHLEEFKTKLSKEDFDPLNAHFSDTVKARLDEMRQSLEKYKNH